MSEIIKKATIHNWVFWVCLIVSLGLGITGSFMPPQAEVHGTVLTLIGELFAFATLGVVGHAIDKGIDVKLKHGNTEATIGDLNK